MNSVVWNLENCLICRMHSCHGTHCSRGSHYLKHQTPNAGHFKCYPNVAYVYVFVFLFLCVCVWRERPTRLGFEIYIGAHSWYDGYFTSIILVGCKGKKGRGSSLQESVSYTYTLRLY